MIGIYKITNKLNGKSYIGQSKNIERRWKEHCRESTESVISNAIKKYGKENFNFEVIEECEQQELNEKENYYIQLYNSIVPYGYNVIESSNENYTSYVFLSKEDILNIIKDIKYSQMTFQEIANKFNISSRTIYYINKGTVHRFNNEQYPLREVKDFSKKIHLCVDCGKEISKSSIRCVDCYKKYNRRSCPLNREELKDAIRIMPFTKIGEKFGYSDNMVKKWCKWFNLPFLKKDINSYSDEEWEKI